MKLKLSTKLLAAFLATGILPLMTAGLIALNKSAEALEEKAMNQLISVRDMKNQEVREYFNEREANLSTLVETVEAWEDEAIQKLVGIREAKRGEVESYFSFIEEMKSMVARGEELASRTNQNAQGASEAVNRGQVAMRALKGDVDSVSVSARQLDTAMEEIKSSSTAISQIIKTIDEIAFQTNILALNAAVEAARAGEAGAGFAVVADEVRTLAGRASEAASQTATMIQKSVESSKRGVEVNTTVARQLENVLSKAEEVDSGLQDIVAGVAGVTEAMAQLETSSHEQREGIDQVTLAVAQVNEVTQQNAASAEEAASASEEMNAQAVHLQEIVSELMRVVSGTSASGGVPALDAPRRGAGTAQRSLG